MRRWISALLTSLMVANVVAWPSAMLAEVLEHEQEVVQFDAETPPVELSASHCQHGCAGHYGQHFQWQVTATSLESRLAVSDSIAAAIETIPPLYVPALPFRPPLTAPIQS